MYGVPHVPHGDDMSIPIYIHAMSQPCHVAMYVGIPFPHQCYHIVMFTYMQFHTLSLDSVGTIVIHTCHDVLAPFCGAVCMPVHMHVVSQCHPVTAWACVMTPKL